MLAKSEGFVCVFDCESIPDVELIRKAFGFEGSDLELSKKALAQQKEKSGSEFLPLSFHKVISICAVLSDGYGKFIKVNKIEGDDEKTMIENFFNFIDKYEPRLVSFNGKNYDMPLLVLRALKYNIKARTYLDISSDKWNNYKTRYSENKHCDLLESLGGFNIKGLRLDTLCLMAGLPGKYDVCGAEVLDLFYEGKLEKIHEYCQSDVLNTYMLFLKYELIKGNINDSDYTSYLSLMCEYLKEKKPQQSYTEFFIKACENELAQFQF